jgi:hypothetical protein
MLMVLSGLAFLCISCVDYENGDAPLPEMTPAQQAERALLQTMAIEPGALVSFVGPVEPRTILESAVSDSPDISIMVPWDEGPHCVYMFFVNDHPDQRYEHDVRYAWLNMNNRHFEQVGAHWWPRLSEWPIPSYTDFELIRADFVSGVTFYYGRGGGNGFPPTYLPAVEP